MLLFFLLGGISQSCIHSPEEQFPDYKHLCFDENTNPKQIKHLLYRSSWGLFPGRFHFPDIPRTWIIRDTAVIVQGLLQGLLAFSRLLPLLSLWPHETLLNSSNKTSCLCSRPSCILFPEHTFSWTPSPPTGHHIIPWPPVALCC